MDDEVAMKSRIRFKEKQEEVALEINYLGEVIEEIIQTDRKRIYEEKPMWKYPKI